MAFIGSVDDDGFPNTKAMLPPRKREGIREFWFTTNTSSRRVAQYRANPNAAICFHHKRFFRGVRLIGVMEVLTDAESKEMIWKDGDKFKEYLDYTKKMFGMLEFDVRDAVIVAGTRSAAASEQEGLGDTLISAGVKPVGCNGHKNDNNLLSGKV